MQQNQLRIGSFARGSLPSQIIESPRHSPSAPHIEVLFPLLHRKPSSHSNVATLPNVVPVADNSTMFCEVGWPQSTTELGETHFQVSWSHRIIIDTLKRIATSLKNAIWPWQEAWPLSGWNGSVPLWIWYPSWQLQSKLPSRFLHWPPSPQIPTTLHSSMSA